MPWHSGSKGEEVIIISTSFNSTSGESYRWFALAEHSLLARFYVDAKICRLAVLLWEGLDLSEWKYDERRTSIASNHM